jgi:enoyl-CoA hydratase/carnithine racemase
MSSFSEYRDKYAQIKMERGDDGILAMTFHTDGGPLQFGADHLDAFQVADAFIDIANDPANRVVIMTGTGDSFCARSAPGLAAAASEPKTYDYMYRNRRRLLLNLMEIEAPIISAINGPALFHAEIPMLADIILASDTASFQDPHAINGSVPGDGAHVIWTDLLGTVRGKYFLLTGEVIDAIEAHRLGIVNEVLSPEKLMDRAWEHAHNIAPRPVLSNRYTRAVINFELRRLLQEHLSHGLVIEGLAQMELGGWRIPNGGTPPSWPPVMIADSPLRPNVD